MDSLSLRSLFKKQFIIACYVLADPALFIKAIKIAIVVGTLLNLINQGDALLAFDTEKIIWGKFLLTYTVPFFVSSYTAISMSLAFKIAEIAPISAQVRCETCKKSIIQLKQGALIPECPICTIKTKWKFYK